jgi:adenosylmethionine-8-amino-7-oxononanoate aminotransferase
MNELKQWADGEPTKRVIGTCGYYVRYENSLNIDIQSGNTAYTLGYANSEILDAIRSVEVDFLRGNSGETTDANEELVRYICEKGNWKSVAWAVSGSDAVEAAIAMNDCYWQYIGKDKPKIISFAPGYHGTTMLAKHLRGEYPYLNRAEIIPAPDWKLIQDREEQESLALASVEQKLQNDSSIGCIIMETIPWMPSISPYSQNWWNTIRRLCDKHNVLMIVDDVAVCWGKNGTMFGWQKYGIQPDISSIGKSLTAGYSPLGAAVCNAKVSEVLNWKSWEHGHTWAPNMHGVLASLTATKKIESLLHRVPKINKELVAIAKELHLNYRTEGLFISYDFDKYISLGDLNRVGLSASIPSQNSVKVIAPLIADETYFAALKQGLLSLK